MFNLFGSSSPKSRQPKASPLSKGGPLSKGSTLADINKQKNTELLSNEQFQKACVYVFNNHLSKPYTDFDEKDDDNITDYVIYADEFKEIKTNLYRPNNGLANAIRTAIIVYDISSKNIDLAIYSLFWKSGRENELSASKPKCQGFLKQSHNNAKVFNNKFSNVEAYTSDGLFTNNFKDSNDGLNDSKPDVGTQLHNSICLRIANELDFVRCCKIDIKTIERMLTRLEKQKDLDRLLDLTLKNIALTGDRIEIADNLDSLLKGDISKERFQKLLNNEATNNDRINNVFYNCSTNVNKCIQALSGITISSKPLTSVVIDNSYYLDNKPKIKDKRKSNADNNYDKYNSYKQSISGTVSILLKRKQVQDKSLTKSSSKSKQSGGQYYEKYLKYKNKYLELKQNI